MKTTKRFLSALLALAMVLSICPAILFAATAAEVEMTDFGVITGMPENATGITYLSDLYQQDIADASTHQLVESPTYVKYSYVKGNSSYPNGRIFSVDQTFFSKLGVYGDNGGTWTYLEGSKTCNANGHTYTAKTIALGLNGKAFTKGLGLQPATSSDAKQSTVVFDISSLAGTHFYAAVGIVGKGNNETQVSGNNSLTFNVYGSTSEWNAEDMTAMTWVKLASCEDINNALVGEFNVNVADYTYLKLECVNEGDQVNNDAVWADACVYVPYTTTEVSRIDPAKKISNTVASGTGLPADKVTYLSSQTEKALVGDGTSAGADPKYTKDAPYSSTVYMYRYPEMSYRNSLSADRDLTDPVTNVTTTYKYGILLGAPAAYHQYGLGVHPCYVGAENPGGIVYDVSSLNVNRFYAVVGATGANPTAPATSNSNSSYLNGADYAITFELWGSAAAEYSEDMEFVKLAYVDNIYYWLTAEFNVDITGFNYLKLVTRMTDGMTSNSGCAAAWGSASVYTATGEDLNYTVEYKYCTDGKTRSYTAFDTANLAADALVSGAVAPMTAVNKAYLTAQGLPGSISDGTNTYVLANVDEKIITENDTVITVYYDAPGYVQTDNFVITPTSKDTTADTLGGVDLSYWEYVSSSYCLPSDSTARYVGVDKQYNTNKPSATNTGGTTYKIGGNMEFSNYFSLHPTATTATADSYVVLNLSHADLTDNYFYAVVGMNGDAWYKPHDTTTTKYGVVFRVYGSSSANGDWTLLACSGEIEGSTTGEFRVFVGDYDYLKLEVDLARDTTTHSSSAIIWGNPTLYSVNPYEGKTVSILGDSISTWTHVSNDVTANTNIANNKGYFGAGRYDLETRQDTWWQQAIDALGMELVVNNSWGGSCVLTARSSIVDGKETLGEASVGWGDRSVNLHNNISDTYEVPDVILVFMGTNDFSYYPDTLGTYEDIDFTTLVTGDGAAPTTTCEAYAVMLARMQAMYPDAEIWCMTPLPREEGAAVGDPTEFCADLAQIAEHYGCGVVNMSSLFGSDTETYHTYISSDDVHPLKAGMDAISQAVVGALLGDTTELYDVSFDLENVESVDGRVAIAGDSYTATLRAAEKVTVTMGGEDITSSCYANGVVTIDKVTGDVVITASSDSVKISTIGKSDSLNGRPESVNLQYLSSLHDTTTGTAGDRTQIINNGTNEFVITVPSKVTLNESYSYPNFYFISDDRKQSNGGDTAVDGYREFNEVQYNTYGIHLGYVAKTYEYGLGVHPNAVGSADNEIVYNVSELEGDRFYAVVGVNGGNITNQAYYSRYVNFEVWGSTDGNSYERIAHALDVRAYLTAEFDLDISGYSYIKLVTRMSDESRNNWSCAAAWADACVYDLPVTSTGNNIRLQDNLKIGYYFALNSTITPSSVGATLYTAADYAAGNEGTEYADLTATNGEYVVENAGVCPQDIGDVYVLVPYYVDSEGVAHYGQAVEYSVLEYCKKVYNMTDEDWTGLGYTAELGAQTKAIIIDLLNYATAASAYLDSDSAQTYNDFLTDGEKTVAWVEETHSATHPETVTAGTPTVTLDGRNINLNESIHLGIYLIDENAAITGVSWCTADGTEYTAAEWDSDNKRYVVTGILADKIYDSYYIRVSEGDETYAEYGFCVAAYLTDLMNHDDYKDNTTLVNLCKAMQVYGYNAAAYFA